MNTISDKEWMRLQDRARRANPSIADPLAVRRRKQASKQLRNARWN